MISKSVKAKRRANKEANRRMSFVKLNSIDARCDAWLVSFPWVPSNPNCNYAHLEIYGKTNAMKKYSSIIQSIRRTA